MELCLGTVQFGMDYGIQGGKKPNKEHIFDLLQYAASNGIPYIDTACGYGDAERILGEFHASSANCFQIITKLPNDIFKEQSAMDYIDNVRQFTETSLQHLMLVKLYGLLFHNPKDLYNDKAVKALLRMKEEGLTEHIGVSVYEPQDAVYAKQLGFELIQLPLNLFNRSFEAFIKSSGTSIKTLARSVYLQGLLLMDTDKVLDKLPAAYEYIKQFDELCKSYSYTRREVALAYIKQFKDIDTVIFGVDHLVQLKENIEAFQKVVPIEIVDEILRHFEKISEEIASPLNWHLGGR